MKWKRVLVAAAGFALLGVLVACIGTRSLLAQLIGLKRAVPALVLILLLRLTVRTWNWWLALGTERFYSSPARLLGARLAAEAVGYLSFMGPFVSEPLKPLLLGRDDSVRARVSGTLVETSLYYLSTALLVLAGSLAGVLAAVRPPGALALFFVGIGVFTTAVFLLFRSAPLLPRFLQRFGRLLKNRPAVLCQLRRAAEIETQIRSFRSRHPWVALRIFLMDLLAQSLTVCETAAVLWALGIGFHWLTLVSIEAAIRTVKIAALFIPGRIGVDEGGAAGAFLLFGLSPAAGFTLAVARRLQAFTKCVAGLTWLVVARSRHQREEWIHASTDIITPHP